MSTSEFPNESAPPSVEELCCPCEVFPSYEPRQEWRGDRWSLWGRGLTKAMNPRWEKAAELIGCTRADEADEAEVKLGRTKLPEYSVSGSLQCASQKVANRYDVPVYRVSTIGLRQRVRQTHSVVRCPAPSPGEAAYRACLKVSRTQL